VAIFNYEWSLFGIFIAPNSYLFPKKPTRRPLFIALNGLFKGYFSVKTTQNRAIGFH
jgi:hypothetical protein